MLPLCIWIERINLIVLYCIVLETSAVLSKLSVPQLSYFPVNSGIDSLNHQQVKVFIYTEL